MRWLDGAPRAVRCDDDAPTQSAGSGRSDQVRRQRHEHQNRSKRSSGGPNPVQSRVCAANAGPVLRHSGAIRFHVVPRRNLPLPMFPFADGPMLSMRDSELESEVLRLVRDEDYGFTLVMAEGEPLE